MAKSNKNPRVDFYFDKAGKWHDELELLRTIILDYGLTEVLKWGTPCYMLEKSNIVLVHVFKDYCAVLFFKGALLKDPKGVLVQQTKNVQAARQMRFIDVAEIVKAKATLKACIREAIEVDKAGLRVTLKKTAEFEMPEEFQTKLNEKRALRTTFYKLTPGRQRGYLLHFSSAKQSKTREARIEKCIPLILRGEGLND